MSCSPVRSAPTSFALVRLAADRLAERRPAPLRSTSVRFAPMRLVSLSPRDAQRDCSKKAIVCESASQAFTHYCLLAGDFVKIPLHRREHECNEERSRATLLIDISRCASRGLRYAPLRLAPVRSELLRSALLRLTSLRHAPVKHA